MACLLARSAKTSQQRNQNVFSHLEDTSLLLPPDRVLPDAEQRPVVLWSLGKKLELGLETSLAEFFMTLPLLVFAAVEKPLETHSSRVSFHLSCWWRSLFSSDDRSFRNQIPKVGPHFIHSLHHPVSHFQFSGFRMKPLSSSTKVFMFCNSQMPLWISDYTILKDTYSHPEIRFTFTWFNFLCADFYNHFQFLIIFKVFCK